MPELDADFEISTNNLEAEYELGEGQHFDCSFEIYASGTTWGSITGNIEEQTDLQDIFSDLRSNIDDIADDLSIEIDNRQSADIDLQDNIDTVDGKIDTHIADKTNPHEVTKTQVGLGNVDNTSDLNKPISTATQTALNNKQDIINDLSQIRSNASNGQSAYNTIQTYGDIVTYDASNFATSTQGQKADTALQPNDNITELNNNAGYITSASLPTVNNNKITIQKNSTDAGSFTLNQSSDKTINLLIPTQASDINAVPTSRKINNKALSSDITLTASDVNALSSSTTINDLTTSAQQDALDSGATSTNIRQITTNANDIADIEDLIPTQATSSNQLADKSFVNSSIATNTANFIGTFNSVAELEAYSGTLTNNDYAFVETTDTAGNTLYDRYKWNGTQWLFEYELNNSSFTSNQWASINSGITSNDVTLIGTALQPNDNISSLTNDAGYITSSSLPTVNNGTLTIQQNGTDVQTFGANQSSSVTANITVPTDTNDLTNGAGFITNSALSGYATTTDLTNGLATKQDTISDLSTIRSNATNGQSAYTTIGGYGDIVTHNASEFATSSQGNLADTSIQPNDNISLLNNNAGFITGIDSTDVITALGYTPYDSTNPNGFTSNVGTVTSVNNTQPDANGNVTISVTGGANTDLSNLTATGEAHFQKPLVSGTNIKTINNTSVLGSGNIDTSEIFVATYGTTTFQQVSDAFNANKAVFCKRDDTYKTLAVLKDYGTTYFTFFGCQPDGSVRFMVNSSNTWTSNTYTYLTSSSSEVASSRFDGQWVYKFLSGSSATAVGTVTIDLSSYLPSDSYKYEVLINLCLYSNPSSGATDVFLWSDVFQNTNTGQDERVARCNANSRASENRFTMPVGTGRWIKRQIVDKAATVSCNVSFWGYRRIGTNT